MIDGMTYLGQFKGEEGVICWGEFVCRVQHVVWLSLENVCTCWCLGIVEIAHLSSFQRHSAIGDGLRDSQKNLWPK